ncbi:MAG TPA: M67 family metallopeptidase [Gemmataceae bacterium]|nr:M67 family metallopeptidase [Gemmataceae bacterium]
MPFHLLVPRGVLEGMIAQALAEQPLECCGLLAGVREEAKTGENTTEPVGRVVRRYPLVNEAASAREFVSEARSMFDACTDMRLRGLEMLAVFHSHPTSRPVPSRTDLERHGMEDVVCIIVSLAGAAPEVRAWRLTDVDYREAQWTVIDDSAYAP